MGTAWNGQPQHSIGSKDTLVSIQLRPPNGWRLSGARRSPPDGERSPRTDFGRSAARVRCSRGLGARREVTW